MSGKEYVVFGATGHVGGIVARRIAEAGRPLRVVARSASGLAALARAGGRRAVAGSGVGAGGLRAGVPRGVNSAAPKLGPAQAIHRSAFRPHHHPE